MTDLTAQNIKAQEIADKVSSRLSEAYPDAKMSDIEESIVLNLGRFKMVISESKDADLDHIIDKIKIRLENLRETRVLHVPAKGVISSAWSQTGGVGVRVVSSYHIGLDCVVTKISICALFDNP